jgi:SAM-dependent methyltransferase
MGAGRGIAAHQCHLCGETVCTPIMRENKWEYFRCDSCGLVFLHPQPSAAFLRDHYDQYLPVVPEMVEAWRQLMKPVYSRSAALIEARISTPGKLLDVGCGFGFFAALMAERGWQVEGLEISGVGRDYARTVLGLEVSPQPLPRPEWPEASFDVISLFYVIEHLAEPITILKEVYRLLRPGGILVLRWPHTTPIVKLLGPWARSLRLYQAPSHLFDFSPQTIHRLVAEVGFQEIHTVIGGWTRPKSKPALLASMLFGSLGEVLARWSRHRLLLPGISKTTLAQRPMGHSMLSN